MPLEYQLIRAAKVLGCTPWELENQSAKWKDWAFISERADNIVMKELRLHPKKYED